MIVGALARGLARGWGRGTGIVPGSGGFIGDDDGVWRDVASLLDLNRSTDCVLVKGSMRQDERDVAFMST